MAEQHERRAARAARQSDREVDEPRGGHHHGDDGEDHKHRSRLRASISRWASSDREEARELRQDTRKAGLVTVAEAPDREPVILQGTLKTVSLRPRGGVPALEAELYDGSGSITVLWLGRRRIAGITPGRGIRVMGRVGVHDGHRVMYNPRYFLRP
ncbi:OB-fold nucleic acid binding domain-containing protein [Nocardioides aurantiacus]|uniref:ATP-dependent DNA helicase RecG n=1 Tax=Nocardioides aurantiacus TaxID=86796 RepID=A0A3N2CUY1_9ACTN|nr:OB-fold nucleic acid binding domain-containing protein [Nocardioides aurantiacus]ROR91347.1 ATP-dependent DNA helicase RecG [Nocardioides aurantiacus]